MNITYPKLKVNRTTSPEVVPTIPNSNDHTDGTWRPTDIYEGELFLNLPGNKLWTRYGATAQLINNYATTLGLTGSMLQLTRKDGSVLDADLSSLISGLGIVSKTYTELKAMYDGSTLTPGQLYKMTDFATVHYIRDFTTVTTDIHTGTTEPLILLATSTNTFDKQAYSVNYPKDIIRYDITGGNNADISFFKSNVPVDDLKGIITYREDTELNIKCRYDFRNVVMYRGVTPVEYPTFDFNYTIYNIDISQKTPSFISRINNIVFLGRCYNNSFGGDCQSNTIGDTFHSNTIGNYFVSNTIGNSFVRNTIGDEFQSNTIGNTFFSNSIGNSFAWNIIGDSFSWNSIGNSFSTNSIGNSFVSNTIGDEFKTNTIGNTFYFNSIGNDFGSNTTGNDFQRNDAKYSPRSIDFTTATHVYADYNCEIFKNSAGVLRLKYINDVDTIKFVDITD